MVLVACFNDPHTAQGIGGSKVVLRNFQISWQHIFLTQECQYCIKSYTFIAHYSYANDQQGMVTKKDGGEDAPFFSNMVAKYSWCANT